MPPTRAKAKMKGEVLAGTSPEVRTSDPGGQTSKESIVTAPSTDTTPTVSPTAKTPPRRVLRLKCSRCNDSPDGFRSEHELRRHVNRVHSKSRKVWVTVDASEKKDFLANCKACQTGKRYNECYNAASHLRRMHFHPHKRGERKMTAAEARRGGKPGDLDPPMEVLKAHWLREVEEFVEEGGEPVVIETPGEPLQLQPPPMSATTATSTDSKAARTPTTPSTRSMAIGSIVDPIMNTPDAKRTA